MPALKCGDNKWKWGVNGACIYSTKAAAEAAGRAIQAQKNRNINRSRN